MVINDIAILLKKIVIGGGTYLFIPIEAIVGNYDNYVFYGENGKNYCYIRDSINMLDDLSNCCCSVTPIKFCNDFSDYKTDYFKMYSNTVYFGKYSDEIDDIDLININLNNLFNNDDKRKFENLLSIVTSEILENFDKDHLLSLNRQVSLFLDNVRNYLNNFEEKIKKQNELERVFFDNGNNIDVLDVYNKTKQVVIGQDEAVRTVISSLVVDDYANKTFEKNRCLLVGKTGTGKTEIIRTIGKLVDRPFIRTDSTQITVAGYVGGSIENNILIPLLDMCQGNLKEAERGIVALDEIDKKGSEKNDDVSGRGVLNSFLPFLDGTNFYFSYKGKPIVFDTSNLSVFALGAFSNIFEQISEQHNFIGFNCNDTIFDKTQITFDDFINIGLMPNEFMGRFPIIKFLNDLGVDDFVKILTESSNSPILFYQNFFANKYNIKLNCTDDFIESVAYRAIDLKRGGRSLKPIIESALEISRWEIFTNPFKYHELTVNKETVIDNKKYVLK